MLQVQSIVDMMYCFIAGRKMFAVSSANVVHRGYITAIAKEDGSEYNYILTISNDGIKTDVHIRFTR